jgi:hypothetical protein
MTPQDIETLSRITAAAAEGACNKALMPLFERLGRIEGALPMGAQRMDGLDSDITEHGRRLDGHDDDHKEHREQLAQLRARRAEDRSPPRGTAALSAKIDEMPVWKRELLGVLIRWGVPAVLFLVFYALTHGAQIPIP